MNQEWHSLELRQTFDKLNSSREGLTESEAHTRRREFGKNEISDGNKISPINILIEQFRDTLILILMIAALISLFIGHRIDAYLILTIVIANGVFGFMQDWKAEKSIEALKQMSSPVAIVKRDGKKKKVDSKLLVPGDIIFLAQGDIVTADARIIEQQGMKIDESALTGESEAVGKKECTIERSSDIVERTSMVYQQTNVVKGRGKAIVVSTGMNTQIGQIASELQKVEDKETLFQKETNKLGTRLGILIIGICTLLIPVLYFRGSEPITAFLTAIALAVAAVPEGLPAIVTLTMALGTRKMLDRKALVRRLSVVESLGSIDVICTDKTGTLTESKMVVKKIFLNDEDIEVSGGFSDHGNFTTSKNTRPTEHLEKILYAGALCNDSEIRNGEMIGDPTEAALVQSARKAGYKKKELEKTYERIDEIPFSSDRKMMSTVHHISSNNARVFSKGAPEVLLDKCDRYLEKGDVKKLTEKKKKEILEKNVEYADQALRVLAMAYKPIDPVMIKGEKGKDIIEKDLIFLGLQGMIDPPRREVKEAIAKCRKAGIRTVMITGDNITTAKAIGRELGFEGEGVTGKQLDSMSDQRFEKTILKADIFARVSPIHKVNILKTLRAQGHRVAMTGDGVNDAPALKASDVGISMGIRGTDVSKQASDIILLDDNFATIEAAVEEGRGIFDNIKKFVNLLLSGNMGEVLIVLIGALIGLGLPLTAVMLLWVNLLTDGLPALAMGVDPHSDKIMDRSPRDLEENIIDKTLMFSIAWIGIWVTVICLSMYWFGLNDSVVKARTYAFTSLVILELIEVFPIRSRYGTPFISNRWLGLAIGTSLIMHMMVLYTPLNKHFKVIPLGITEWFLILTGAATFIGLMYLMRKIEKRYFPII